MSIADAQLKEYWRKISALSDHLVSETAFMRSWATEIPAHDNGDDVLRQVVADLIAVVGNPPHNQSYGSVPDPSGQHRRTTPAGDNKYIGGLRLLLEELATRANALPRTPHRDMITRLLAADVHLLAARFGSFTAAWDHLAILKYETTIQDSRRRKFDAWFSAVVGVSERFLRDTVGVTIEYAGRELMGESLIRCLSTVEPGLPQPNFAHLVQFPSTDAALREIVIGYMDRGPRHTTRLAGHFAAALGTELFPPDADGFEPGMLTEISVLGDRVEDAWNTLLELRRHMVQNPDQPHDTLYELDESRLQLIADFLCAFSFGFAARIIVAVADLASAAGHENLVGQLRWQFSMQLRVLVMRLLGVGRYGLAWSIAETGLRAEPAGSKGDMLRLNSLFARMRLGSGYASRHDIEGLEVSPVPRYRLLKLVLLGILHQADLEPLLNEAVRSRDVSLDELERWPALEELRGEPWWRGWAQRAAPASGGSA